MNDENLTSREVVIKEYPNSTHWVEGQQVIGVGNLILTNERLVFLHQVALSEKEIESLRNISGKATTNEMIDLSLSLHKKNFQFPLSSITRVKTGLYCLIPFPRPCLRIFYRNEKKKQNILTASFMFTIPLLKGFVQLEITTVRAWVLLINRAVKRNKASADTARN